MQNQIPKNWQKAKLGDLALLNPPVSVHKNEDCSFIPMEDLDWNKKFVSPKISKAYKGGTKFIEDDILFARITPCLENGKIGRARGLKDGRGFGSTEYFIIRGKEGISDTDFLYYLCRTHKVRQTAINSMLGASGRQRAFIDSLQSYELNFPDFPEQKRISSILSAFDNKIEVNTKIAKTLEEMVQVIFKERFINKKNWKNGKLGELVKVKNGYAFKSKDYQSHGVPIVRTLNFTNDGSIILNDVVYITPEKAKEYTNFHLDRFDLLLVMVGASLGKIAICPSNILPALQNQNMWSFKPINEEFRFYNNLLLRKIINEQRGSATGSARDFFRKDYFYSLDVPIPDPITIESFNKIVAPMYLRMDNILGENQRLAAMRDLLLPKLMKGEIKV